MYSNFLQPCITEPTRIVGNNRPAFADNIFINTYNKNKLKINYTVNTYKNKMNFSMNVKNITEIKLIY